ncbi:ImmA/IrrE family metallo-endopeptidase [Streptomyces luteolifulvus]|uniref:ImmA/IrrE family metallo-endopeptidase n=1 Tax=Streptomyces luteolifulvus TaxID=2615112 RepID=A0A6H9UX01_9ACTN|nr:XRE family transcriptional regulator [Streptomyces luteolifulvus]KAB1144462.1 ImmA/IrrE family metallo-endopeptidase [Streptomyces luteolifulvus]
MESEQSWAAIGVRIAETRESVGLSQGELASRIGVDRTAVVRMEQGERKVSALELFRIADALGAPPAHFLTRPPAALVSRRKTLDSPVDAATRDSYRLDIRLEEHARNAEWLVAEGFLTPPPLADLLGSAEAGPIALARAARRVAGVPQGPLGPMASVVERFGLYLTVVPEPSEGASLLLDTYGVSVISSHSAPGRRRWTAAHELGHHLLQDEYHSDAGVSASRDEREQVIDDFAGEFLLPEDELEGAWKQEFRRGHSPRDALIGIAADYRLSWSATVSRAQQLGLVSTSDARRLKADTPIRGDFLATRGAEPVADLEEGATGAAWRHAVLTAWKVGAVSAARTVELLYGALQETELPEQLSEDVEP